MPETAPQTPALYFHSLTVENLKCFASAQTLNLHHGEEPAMFTVILADNGMGKTTLLQALAGMEVTDFKNSQILEKNMWFSSWNFLLQKTGLSNKQIAKQTPFFAIKKLSNYIKLNSTTDIIKNDLFFNKEIHEVDKISKEKYEFAFNHRKTNLISYDFSFPGTEGRIMGKSSGFSFYDADNSHTIFAYGPTRQIGDKGLDQYLDNNWHYRTLTLFDTKNELLNAIEWLFKNWIIAKIDSTGEGRKKLNAAEKIIKDFLPEVVEDPESDNIWIDYKGDVEKNNVWIEVHTRMGWVDLRQLSHGYQSMIALTLDLAHRMFLNFPKSKNPLHEPAVVLIDELDLHLHPNWQRRIVKDLREHFPRVQFICTSHSPVVVQCAEEVNLVKLEWEEDGKSVRINNLGQRSYQGWSVDEILYRLMDIESTKSDEYNRLRKAFSAAAQADNYIEAEKILNQLAEIMPPGDRLDLLKMELAGVTPEVE